MFFEAGVCVCVCVCLDSFVIEGNLSSTLYAYIYSSLRIHVLILTCRLILYLILNSDIYDTAFIIKTTHQMAGLIDSFRYISQ